jgi:hypothetical protein
LTPSSSPSAHDPPDFGIDPLGVLLQWPGDREVAGADYLRDLPLIPNAVGGPAIVTGITVTLH